MSCHDCGGEVITEKFRICTQCGIIQDSRSAVESATFLFEQPTIFQEGCSYVQHHEVISTRGFKTFKELYLSLTYVLCSNYGVVEKGKQLLSKLYKFCKHSHTQTKFSLIAALLYCLHLEENSFSHKQFQQRVGLELPKFTSSLQKVRMLFNFPGSFKMEDHLNSILESITKLSKIVLKPKVSKSIEDSELINIARRLAKVIHSKSWANQCVSSMSYIDQVSAVSTILACHYCISCTTRKSAKGRALSSRYSCVELAKVAEFSTISTRQLWSWIKVLQERLYVVYEHMIMKPAKIKHSREIGNILVEILDYIDLDLFEDETETEDAENVEGFIKAKSYLLNCLQSFLPEHDFITNNNKVFPWQLFVNCLTDQQKQNDNNNFKDFECELKLTEQSISIGPHKFHTEHIELMKTLILHGCTVAELETDRLSQLIRIYIESKAPPTEDDDLLTDADLDGDVETYIKNPEELQHDSYFWFLGSLEDEKLKNFQHLTSF